MKKFEIILKNEKLKAYGLINLLILLLHVVFFISLLFDNDLWKRGASGLILIATYAVYRLIISKKNAQKFHLGQGFLFVFILLTSFMWLFILDIIFLVLGVIASQQITFEFYPSFIKQKNFPWKRYQWQQFDNVILKDNILTLDFKNNTVVQSEIMSPKALKENEFNLFVREQLIIHR